MDTKPISEDELDDLLLGGDPVRRESLDDEDVRSALRAVRTSVESRGLRHERSRRTRVSAHRRRWAAVAAAATVVVAASLVGIRSLTGNGRNPGPFSVRSAAAAQLNRVAQAAARQPTPRPGQWAYQVTTYYQTSTKRAGGAIVAYSDTLTEQDWVRTGKWRRKGSHHGQRYWQERTRLTNSFSFLTPRDRATYLAHRSAFDRGVFGHQTMKPGVVSDAMTGPTFARSAGQGWPDHGPWETSPPSDPRKLLSEMWRQEEPRATGAKIGTNTQPCCSATTTSPSGATTPTHTLPAGVNLPKMRARLLWGGLVTLLQDSTSAKLRATAYRALAYLPDTTVLGQRTDHLGRPGLAVRFTGDSGPEAIIVSPTTGDLLELYEPRAHAAHGMPAGSVSYRIVYGSRAIVGSPAALPGGGTQPFRGTSKS